MWQASHFKPLICKWTTHTQHIGQMNTLFIWLGTSYMCIKVVLEFMSVKGLKVGNCYLHIPDFLT